MDERWNSLGQILIKDATETRKGERLMISLGETAAYPLARAVYRAAIEAGAHVQIQFSSTEMRRILLQYGSNEQISWQPEMELQGMDWADVYIGLRGSPNPFELQKIDSDKLAINQATMGEISKQRWQKTRWCLVRVPGPSLAQQAESNYEDILNMFFASCLLDWQAERQRYDNWCRWLNTGKEVHITGKKTDLHFSVAGRRWVPFAGSNNMPDGEIATAPIVSTVEGHIYFEHPGILSGRFIHNIELAWKDGVLVHASSTTEQDFLRSIVATDAGSSLIGEFAFGTNRYLDRFCNDILIDEKIAGTVHIALGRAYPECGGTNSSVIHWDIVKDLRHEGCLSLDGEKIIDRGRIVLSDEKN